MNKQISIVMMTSFSGENYKAPNMIPVIKLLYEKKMLGKSFGIWDQHDSETYEKENLRLLKRSKLVKVLFKITSILFRKGIGGKTYLLREKIFGICALILFRTDAEVVVLKPRPAFLVDYYKRKGKIVVVEASENHPRFAEERIKHECAAQNIPLVQNNYTNSVAIDDFEAGINMADYLLCLTKFSAKTYCDKAFPKDKIGITGLEVKMPIQGPRDINDAKITFVCVANHGILKGTHRLIKLWKEKNIPHELLIIGLLYDDIKQYIKKIGLSENIKIMGHMKREDINEIYEQRKCVGVLMSLSESYGRGVYECLCTSTPVMVTNTCTCDLVEHKKNGYIVSDYDDESIYEGLSYFIGMSGKEYYDMSMYAYETVLKKQDRFAERYIGAIQEGIEKYRKTAYKEEIDEKR